jgi:hypothetical protein
MAVGNGVGVELGVSVWKMWFLDDDSPDGDPHPEKSMRIDKNVREKEKKLTLRMVTFFKIDIRELVNDICCQMIRGN